jgi:hypothetical protein
MRGEPLKQPGIHIMGSCLVVTSIDGDKWHLSISCVDRLPTYEELKKARYKYTPNRLSMAQIFPPREEFVNLHPYCLHLWEIDN